MSNIRSACWFCFDATARIAVQEDYRRPDNDLRPRVSVDLWSWYARVSAVPSGALVYDGYHLCSYVGKDALPLNLSFWSHLIVLTYLAV